MTISDLIARLTRIMKEKGSCVQVKIGSTYNSTDNAFECFEVRNRMDDKDVYLVPSDIWDRSDLKRMAERESQ